MSEQDEKAHIHIAVNKSVKEEWQAYLEEPYTEGSLTSLIERAVGKYIQGEDSGSTSRQTTETEQTPQYTAEMVNGMTRLENLMEDVSDRLSAVEREVSHSEDMKAAMEQVYDVLPPQPYGSEEWEIEKKHLHPDDYDSFVWEGTITAIADALGVRQDRVRLAIRQLQDDTKRVKSVSTEGRTRYWKDEGHSQQRYDQFNEYSGGE